MAGVAVSLTREHVIERILAPEIAAFPENEDALRYQLDPFALADDGHVTILDLETLQEQKLSLWEHQREVIESWIDIEALQETGHPRFRNVHEEKSRQMGLTWVTAYVITWALNFHDVAGLALSQKLGEVCDSGPTTDSFFGKIKFIWEHLPEDIRAPLVFTGGNDPSIRHPGRTNTYLSGEGATPDAGRGGKYDFVFLDEASRIPWGRIVHTAVSRACPNGRFYNSTPNGEDPLYFWLRDTRPRGYSFLRHHWSRNPVYARGLHIAALAPEGTDAGAAATQTSAEMAAVAAKCSLCVGTIDGHTWDAANPRAHRFPGRLTSDWYEQAILDLTDEQVAQELDIDYAGSLPARVFTEFSEERNVVAHIDYEPALPIELAWDYGWEMNAVGIFQDAPGEFRMIGEFERPDLLPEQVAAGVRDVLIGLGLTEDEVSEHQSLQWLCIGDPAGEATQLATGRPLTADYRRLGFNISSRPRSINQTLVATKRLLMGRPKLLVISADTCPGAVRHFRANRWVTDRNGARKIPPVLLNDEHNHLLRAAAYLITHKFPPPAEPDRLEQRHERDETGKVDPGLSYRTQF